MKILRDRASAHPPKMVDISDPLRPEGLRPHLWPARFPETDFLPVRVATAYNPRSDRALKSRFGTQGPPRAQKAPTSSIGPPSAA